MIPKATAPDQNAIRNVAESQRQHVLSAKEIAVLKALDHPHILRIFDHFEHGGRRVLRRFEAIF